MEEKIYKITLGDGTEISNLKLNGMCSKFSSCRKCSFFKLDIFPII